VGAFELEVIAAATKEAVIVVLRVAQLVVA
jgi:hypothetical protein